MLGKFPKLLLGPALRPTTPSPTDPELVIDPALFYEAFAADLPKGVSAVMEASLRQVAAAFSEKSGVLAWKKLPSWFAVAKADNAIGAEAERFYAVRAGSIAVEIDGSHVVMISQPQAIVDLIMSALGSLA